MATLTKGNHFPPTVVSEIFNKAQGRSTLAKLSGSTPIAFNGTEIFTFDMDTDVAIVAEGAAKEHGGATVEPIVIAPIKIEYGARVTDEFIFASEEAQLDILQSFTDGFAKKVARGLDIMAMHGLNPRTKTTSSVIGTNSFDTNTKVHEVSYVKGSEDANIETAAAAIGDYDVTGIAMSKDFSAGLAQANAHGVKLYPELAWGANPDKINGITVDVNSTVNVAPSGEKGDMAIVGDFENAFKWGFAKNINMEVIEYGDPDNTGKDLKGYNQVYLRGEAYIGWGILDPEAFAIILENDAS